MIPITNFPLIIFNIYIFGSYIKFHISNLYVHISRTKLDSASGHEFGDRLSGRLGT